MDLRKGARDSAWVGLEEEKVQMERHALCFRKIFLVVTEKQSSTALMGCEITAMVPSSRLLRSVVHLSGFDTTVAKESQGRKQWISSWKGTHFLYSCLILITRPRHTSYTETRCQSHDTHDPPVLTDTLGLTPCPLRRSLHVLPEVVTRNLRRANHLKHF